MNDYTVDEEVKSLIEWMEPQRRYQFTDMAICSAMKLGEIGPKAAEALPALEKLSKDKNSPEARAAALEAIAKIKGLRSVVELDQQD